MFPDIFIDTLEEPKGEISHSGVDFLFDYETGQHIMKGAVLQECTARNTVRQYIQNVLRTKRNLYKVHTKGEKEAFGLSIYDYIGTRSLPMGYINSELKREVTELLLRHPMISEVKDWTGKREKRDLNISFTAVLTDGSVLEVSQTAGV